MMPRRVLAAWAIGAALVALVGAVLTAPSAAAAGPGYVRIAHFSPDTSAVDVWLTSFRGSNFSKVFSGVGYGALSPYRRVTPGRYAVAVRPPGAAADSPPLLQTTLKVASGRAYTVAGVGHNANISLRVLRDDLTRPANGRARMRVVQASSVAPVIGVAANTGTILTRAAKFPSTTDYAQVPAGRWTVRATPEDPSVEPVEKHVDVKAGRIYTVVVLDQGTTGIQLVVRTDAASASRAPAGPVDTGLGGMARDHGTGPSAPILAIALIGLAGLVYTLGRRLRQQ